MKKNEIIIGGTYSNRKGRIRKVIAEGTEYVLYDGQSSKDNLQYEVINDGTKKNRTSGEHHNMTRQAFATWAKERIE